MTLTYHDPITLPITLAQTVTLTLQAREAAELAAYRRTDQGARVRGQHAGRSGRSRFCVVETHPNSERRALWALADAEPDERARARDPRPAPARVDTGAGGGGLGDGGDDGISMLRAALRANLRVRGVPAADGPPVETACERIRALRTWLTTDVVRGGRVQTLMEKVVVRERPPARLSRAEQQRILEAPSGEEAERELQTHVERKRL